MEEQKRLIRPVTYKSRKTKETSEVLNAIEPKENKRYEKKKKTEVRRQGAKKVIFKACHSGKPQLAPKTF